jgi:small conductance mechanosensitive channel
VCKGLSRGRQGWRCRSFWPFVFLGFCAQVDISKHIIGEIIHNSNADTLAEETVGISYGSDPEKAIAVIIRALEETDKVNVDRSPQVGIEDFADSSINIGIRFWAPTTHYFDTRYRANAAIFEALKAAQIDIPFPQREVRILKDG